MSNSVPQNPKVTIVSDGELVRVTPSELFVAPKSSVKFENLGKGAVTVLFPDKNLFGTNTLTLEEGSEGDLTTMVDQKSFYYYEVYNLETETSTASSTRPIIIVYPQTT